MTVLVDEEAFPPQEQVLQKTVPLVASKLPGTYTVGLVDTVTFNADKTGSDTAYGNFTWSVDGAGKLTLVWDTGGSRSEAYALASSVSTDTAYTTLRMGAKDIENGAVVLVYPWTLTRQGPLSAGISLSADGPLLTGTVELTMMSTPTFYARVSGGTPPYAYNWSLSNTAIFIPTSGASGPTYSMMVSGGVTATATLTLTVTDNHGANSEKTITLHTTGL
jgi:hypothetical protein